MITDFNIGDIFVEKGAGTILIIPCGYHYKNPRYSFAGLDGLDVWSCFTEKGETKQQILIWLNESKCKFSMNINDKIRKSLEFCDKNNKD